ncbi:hypothetical protein [Usitatibacter palustris]|uniref:hypothetical protein n=1 Tax=Usitatibacter palustris TaxID=2732487 RepID=UPI00148921F8|nr:hypothetical protein [Usitatibacter palustris]
MGFFLWDAALHQFALVRKRMRPAMWQSKCFILLQFERLRQRMARTLMQRTIYGLTGGPPIPRMKLLRRTIRIDTTALKVPGSATKRTDWRSCP